MNDSDSDQGNAEGQRAPFIIVMAWRGQVYQQIARFGIGNGEVITEEAGSDADVGVARAMLRKLIKHFDREDAAPLTGNAK